MATDKLKLSSQKNFNHSLIFKQLSCEKTLVNQTEDLASYLVYLTVLQKLQTRVNDHVSFFKNKLYGELKHKKLDGFKLRDKYFAEIRTNQVEHINYRLLKKFLPNDNDYNRIVKYLDEEELFIRTPETTKRLKNYVK